ncbi:hypothetical protein [Methylotenera sp.]|uniref:hypothetical protein n=1 Tax=Methylotenera sp. TaxID=2051956 RepID=UPI0024899DB1|nr:hypothetical protein [Methylotenera sp.]MDI1362569.1 hypothetical protein [Methylotenera sp.]
MPTEAELRQMASEAVPKTTDIYYVDYRDNLNHKCYEEAAEAVLQGGEPYEFIQMIDESIWDWDVDINQYMMDAKATISSRLEGYDEGQIEDIDELINEQTDYIRELIFDRDHSTPVDDLIRNTRDYTLRVHLCSNYEGLDSMWNIRRSGATYDDYMKQMVDALNLNPALVKQELDNVECECVGEWPDMPDRNGNEFVSYLHFGRELNESCSLSQLCLIGTLDPAELKDFTGKIKFFKGANLGLFNPWNGSGSMIEMSLLKDMEIDVNKLGESEYDHFSAHIDSQHHYSMDSVYGPTRKFWGEGVTLS